jgi:hypothetical protein
MKKLATEASYWLPAPLKTEKKLLLPTPPNHFLIVTLFALGSREGDIISDYV